MTSPYRSLDVVETRSRIVGRQFWVRDEDGAYFWCVEFIDRRLVCFCDDGEARQDSPDTEPECIHLRAVVDAGMAERQSSRPHGVMTAGRFVD